MRLIDADKITYIWVIDADGEEHDGVTLQSIIKKMPTVDAVEVVRCKDCIFGEVDDGAFPWQYFCNYTGDNWNDENHFCSYGERKEDND